MICTIGPVKNDTIVGKPGHLNNSKVFVLKSLCGSQMTKTNYIKFYLGEMS